MIKENLRKVQKVKIKSQERKTSFLVNYSKKTLNFFAFFWVLWLNFNFFAIISKCAEYILHEDSLIIYSLYILPFFPPRPPPPVFAVVYSSFLEIFSNFRFWLFTGIRWNSIIYIYNSCTFLCISVYVPL